MSSERWQQIEEIALKAMRLPVEERAAFIRSECPEDPDLQRSVQRWIRDDVDRGTTINLPGDAASGGPTAGSSLTDSLLGSSLSHYRILGKLGEGGMGVVYLAEDENLRRKVALKLLRSGGEDEHQQKLRFRREAQAAATLDHPNITTIYEIGEDNEQTFIAMAFEDGTILSEKIREGPLTTQDALRIAIEIATGLQVAHEHGVTHRDIKPANIMLTTVGGVKVMDFGLAHVATQTRMTRVGTIMGTPAYMSPEQARGATVDHRSDIWSLGVILYEMLTGRLPFRSEIEQAVVHSILHEAPDPVSVIRTELPDEIDQIVSRALAKDPNERYQDAGELRADLRRLEQGNSLESTVKPEIPGHRSGWRMSGIVAGAVIVAAISGIAWWSSGGIPSDRTSVNTDASLLRVTSDAGLSYEPAVSRNGSLLAYASDRSGDGNLDIWVQQVEGRDPIRLTDHPADDHEPALSPDGTLMAFRSEREPAGIYTQPTLGGEISLLAPDGHMPRFSPNGRLVAYRNGDRVLGSAIQIASLDGRPPRPLEVKFDRRPPAYWSNPLWSPDGKTLLFATGNANQTDEWWTVPSTGGQAASTNASAIFSQYGLVRPLPQSWCDDGTIVFSARSQDRANRNLWQFQINPAGLVSGPAERLTFGTGDETQATIGSGGQLVFSSLAEVLKIWSIAADVESGSVIADPETLTVGLSADGYPWISRDGKALVYVSHPQGKGQFGAKLNDVYFKDLETGGTKALVATEASENVPIISADRQEVLYSVSSDGKQTAKLVSVDGGLPATVCEDCGTLSGWSADKSKVLFYSGRPTSVSVLDRSTSVVKTCLEHPDLYIYSPQFSPDDQWITFHARRPNQSRQIFLARFTNQPISQSDWIEIIADEFNNSEPRWSPSGNILYFLSNRDGFLCIWAQKLDPETKRPDGLPFEVYHFHNARRSPMNVPSIGTVRLSIGEGRIVLTLGEVTGNIWRMQTGAESN